MADRNQKFLDQLDGKDILPQPEKGKIQYTSHPILNYKLGTRWQFENGLLTLENAEEEKEFLGVINSPKFPARERARIKKLDFAAAERLAREHIAKSHTTQQFDSSTGERPDNAPRVGTGDLIGDAAKLGIQAAAEGGREQNVPGAPDSNRETQTEPSPQPRPEQPFRAETQGAGGQHSAEQLSKETGGAVDAEQLSQPNANDAKAKEAAHQTEGEESKGPFAALHKKKD